MNNHTSRKKEVSDRPESGTFKSSKKQDPTIKIPLDLKKKLDKLVINKNESYADIIKRILEKSEKI